MKRIILLLTTLIITLFTPLSANAQTDFSFTDLEGRVYTSPGLIGTPLVVNIGAHW